jgi:hypothetical protein
MKSSKAFGVLAAAAFSIFGAHAASATIVTQWAFTATQASPVNSPAPSTGTGTAVSLGMTNSYTYAGGETTPTTTNDDITSVTTTAFGAQDAWRIRGTNNKSGQPGNGWNNSAPNYTQGAEFEVPTTGFNNISIGFDWFTTTQGVGNMQVRYTLDDTQAVPVFTNLGSDFVATPSDEFGGSSATEPNISFPLPAAAYNDPNFAFEMVSVQPVSTDSNFSGVTPGDYASAAGGNYNNSSGNWSFNNITVNGTAVPEPTSASLLGLAGLGLLRRRRTAK